MKLTGTRGRLTLFSLSLGGILFGCSFQFNKIFDDDASPGTGTDTPDTGTRTATESATATATAAGTATPTETETADAGISTDTTGVTSGFLLHRWRFNGDLTDEVGSSDALIITPEDAEGGNASLSDTEVTLAGGGAGEAEYIRLGTHLLANVDGPLTIELFATPLGVRYFARIFEFGGDWDEYLNMTWTVDTDEDRDGVIWWGGDEMTPVWDTNAPYLIDEEYHIVMTVDPTGGDDGNLRIAWYSMQSSETDIGGERDSIETTDRFSGLDDENCWLGKSHSNSDEVANASYNDVRIWSGTLSPEDVELLHDLGPDM